MLNPAHSEIFGRFNVGYYWTAYQSEWATDVMFRNAAALAPVASAMMKHGLATFSSLDVMKFLHPKANGRFEGEIVSDFKDRVEGRRVKFFVGKNSIKFYDKEGSVARVETTICDPAPFKVLRPKEGGPAKDLKLRKLRKGVADLYQRAQVSNAANARLLDAFAAADSSATLGNLVTKVTKPVKWRSREVRGIRSWHPDDISFCRAINDGKFILAGVRNRELQKMLFAKPPADGHERRRRSAKVSRLIRMFRAHGILNKIGGTHRYRVSPDGRTFLAAVLTAQEVTLERLNKLSA